MNYEVFDLSKPNESDLKTMTALRSHTSLINDIDYNCNDINPLSEIKTLTVNEMDMKVDIDGATYDLISHNHEKKEITISLGGVIAVIKYS